MHGNYPNERLVAIEDEAGLGLEFIYGYNGSARNNIAWNPKTGLFAYTSHNMLIIESLDTRKQKHLLGHEEDITTIAVHDNIIATGSVANINGKKYVESIDTDCLEHQSSFGTVKKVYR